MARVKIAKVEKVEKVAVERSKATVAKFDPNAPDFESLLEWDADDDPLGGVDYDEGDLEATADAEMSALVRQIKEEKKARYDRFRVARDPDYYVVLCFQSRDQRDEFLRASGWAPEGERFINGLDVCRRLKLAVEPQELEPLPQRGKPHLYTRKEVL